MALPGETEAGSAGKQPCPGIVRRAHRDDDHGRGNERLAPTLHPIGSKDPDALKIPARRAASTLTRSVRSPVLAEPAHFDLLKAVGTGTVVAVLSEVLQLVTEAVPGSSSCRRRIRSARNTYSLCYRYVRIEQERFRLT